MMVNYYPSNEERLIMSKCIKLGILCKPKAVLPGNRPLVTIEVVIGNKPPKLSSQPPFEQKYLTYRIIQTYKAFYEKIPK